MCVHDEALYKSTFTFTFTLTPYSFPVPAATSTATFLNHRLFTQSTSLCVSADFPACRYNKASKVILGLKINDVAQNGGPASLIALVSAGENIP